MASLSNELEGLSLDLPDVVAEAEAGLAMKKQAASSSPSVRQRGRRGGQKRGEKRKPKEVLQPPAQVEDEDLGELAEDVDGACALAPLDDQRVPEIPLSLKLDIQNALLGLDVDEADEVTKVYESPRLEVKKSGSGRSRRNRKGGRGRKRKPDPATCTDQTKEATAENKENLVVGKMEGSHPGDGSFPFADDSDDDEPKYLWRNVTKNGCIKKCVLVDGKMDLGRPKSGDTVLVKTQGKLKDGTIVDDYPTMVFNVGEYEVVDGLDLAVQSMYKNELSIVSIKPELAYGVQGRGTRAPCGRMEDSSIPGNSRITYLYGLLHFEKAKEMSTMTWAQRRKSGQSRLRLANWWYQRKEYPIAVKCYKKALQYYNDIPTNRECSSTEEYKELLQLMEERLRVMRQVANIFKRIANMIQSGQISV
jgi:hypothetical protein